MHYEDIQLKQSTYAIISFNEWAGAELPRAGLAVWDPPGAPHRAGEGGGGTTTQDVYIHFARSFAAPPGRGSLTFHRWNQFLKCAQL